MTDFLTVLLVIGGLYVTLVLVVHLLASARVRTRIADRGAPPEEIEALLKSRFDARASLRWGLVTLAIGVALAVVQLLPPDLRNAPIAGALVFVFAGAALIAHSRMGADAG